MCIDTNLPVGTKILEHCAQLNQPQRVKQILSIVEHHEMEGARQASWILDAELTLSRFAELDVPMAIVTRNMKQAARLTIEKLNIPIEFLITREDCLPKPDPEGLLMVSREWKIPPRELVYVGDFQFDLIAAKRAKMMSCLLANHRNQHLFSKADKVIKNFSELFDFFR